MANQTNSTQFTQDLDDNRMIEVFKVFLKTFEHNIRILEGLRTNPSPISSPPPLVRLETTGYTTPPAESPRAPASSNTWGELRIQIPKDISEELELMESPVEYNINPEEAAAEYTDTRPSCEECSGCRYCEDSDNYDGSDGYDS
jgi:hypothetical protein